MDDGRVGFYLIDVCGHGVPATFQSIALTRVLASELWPASGVAKGHSPAAIARHLNQAFPVDLDLQMWRYFTFFYAIVDLDRHTLRYVTAGHPGTSRPVRVTDRTATRAGGLPIGLFSDADYEEYEVSLAAGDRIVFHSDGVTEAKDGQDEPYGDGRLLEILDRSRTEALNTSLGTVLSDVRRWRQRNDFDDDVSLVAFEMRSE